MKKTCREGRAVQKKIFGSLLLDPAQVVIHRERGEFEGGNPGPNSVSVHHAIIDLCQSLAAAAPSSLFQRQGDAEYR